MRVNLVQHDRLLRFSEMVAPQPRHEYNRNTMHEKACLCQAIPKRRGQKASVVRSLEVCFYRIHCSIQYMLHLFVKLTMLRNRCNLEI
jgi:hypothetical protein